MMRPNAGILIPADTGRENIPADTGRENISADTGRENILADTGRGYTGRYR